MSKVQLTSDEPGSEPAQHLVKADEMPDAAIGWEGQGRAILNEESGKGERPNGSQLCAALRIPEADAVAPLVDPVPG